MRTTVAGTPLAASLAAVTSWACCCGSDATRYDPL
jgi:hypothetical protein